MTSRIPRALEWALLALVAGLVGCGGPDYDGDQRFPLSGTVTFNGEPVDNVGNISFLPMEGEKKGRVSGGIIQGGKYTVSEARGANAGKHKVQIHWYKPTGKQVMQSGQLVDEHKEAIPDKFHKNSELTVEVGPDKTTFDFDLKSN